jgi:hypothetical protein
VSSLGSLPQTRQSVLRLPRVGNCPASPSGGVLPLLLLPLAVILPTAALAAGGSFDGLYGQDAYAYFDYASGPLRRALLALSPPPPFFWPPGYPLLVALLSLPLGPIPLAGQLVSLLAGGLVPVFTALLAREVMAERGRAAQMAPAGLAAVPLVAGLLTAFNGQLWQSSAVVMADTTGLALATLGAWALARYGRDGHATWLVAAAAALSFATLSRWIYGLVAVPCGLYVLTVLRRRGLGAALAHGALAVLAACLIQSPVLVPALLSLLAPGGEPPPFVGSFQVYSWNPANAARDEFVTADGYLRYRLPNGLYYALTPAHWYFLTPLLAPLILPGLWVVARRRSVAPLLLVGGWAATVYAFHAGAPWQNFRFVLAALPPLAILAALGLGQVRSLVGARGNRLLTFGLAFGLAAMASGGVHLTRFFVERQRDHLAIVEWVEAHAPADGRLLTFNLTQTFRHAGHLETLELYALEPPALADLLADERPTLLLLDVANAESQWRDGPPGRSYRWLRDVPGLTPLSRWEPYTLFRVGPAPP